MTEKEATHSSNWTPSPMKRLWLQTDRKRLYTYLTTSMPMTTAAERPHSFARSCLWMLLSFAFIFRMPAMRYSVVASVVLTPAVGHCSITHSIVFVPSVNYWLELILFDSLTIDFFFRVCFRHIFFVVGGWSDDWSDIFRPWIRQNGKFAVFSSSFFVCSNDWRNENSNCQSKWRFGFVEMQRPAIINNVPIVAKRILKLKMEHVEGNIHVCRVWAMRLRSYTCVCDGWRLNWIQFFFFARFNSINGCIHNLRCVMGICGRMGHVEMMDEFVCTMLAQRPDWWRRWWRWCIQYAFESSWNSNGAKWKSIRLTTATKNGKNES